MFLMCKIMKSGEIVTFLKCQVWNNPEPSLLHTFHLHTQTYKYYGYCIYIFHYTFLSHFKVFWWVLKNIDANSPVCVLVPQTIIIWCIFQILIFVGIIQFFLCGLVQNFSHRIKSTLFVQWVVSMTVKKHHWVCFMNTTNQFLYGKNFILRTWNYWKCHKLLKF